MAAYTADFLIIGAGIIGVNMAVQAKRRYPDSKIIVLEKEDNFAEHASGRNSGVLHAGFYYTADSLKARFTREGNRLLTEYCDEHGLLINKCGKLVVARNEAELESLQLLLQRGQHNDVALEEITVKEAQEIEPRVRTYQKALFSPSTSSVDPRQVLFSMITQAQDMGIEFMLGSKYIKKTRQGIVSNKGVISTGYIINTSGLYADKIARDFGFSKNYTIIPFKGLYIISNEPIGAIRTHIYPVPDLNNPFLGVHFTITASGKIKLGPTAIPAFWREHYKGFENFNLKELIEIFGEELALFLRNEFGFRKLAFEELSKYHKPTMVKLASELANDVSINNFKARGPAGIRAQLYDTKNKKLEMDFKYEGDRNSFHVLNAVSPAFTCSIPFSSFLFDEIDTLLGK
jgi:L-2-hydroxyglutarate oxidase LhgO